MDGSFILKENDFIKALKESSILGIVIYGENGKIIFANKKACRMLDYAQNEVIEKTIFDFFSEGISKKKARENIRRRLSGEIFLEEYEEIYLKSKSGSLVPARVFSYTVFSDNKPHGLLILYDITKEKSLRQIFLALGQINELIIKSENKDELFAGICNVLVDTVGYTAVSIGDIDEKTKLFNIKFARSKSKDLEEGLKNIVRIGVDPKTPYGRGSVSRAYNTKKISFIENTLADKDSFYWREEYIRFKVFSACSIPIFKNNKVEHIILINDRFKNSFTEEYYTLLKKIQDNVSFALENFDRQNRLLILDKALDLSHEWVLITDPNGNIMHVNKAVTSISGYNRNKLINSKPNIFKSGHHKEEFYKQLWGTIKKGKVFEGEFINRKKDGSLFFLDSIIIPIKKHKKIINFVDLSRDITEIIQYQNSLKFQSMLYNILFKLTDLSIKSKNEDEFLSGLTDIFTTNPNVDVAYIILTDRKETNLKYSSTKNNDEYKKLLTTLERFIKERAKEPLIEYPLPAEKAIKYKKVYIINDIQRKTKEGNYAPFDLITKLYGLNSCCALPLIKNSKIFGVLALLSEKRGIFNKEIFNLLKMIAQQIESILNRFEENRFLQIIKTALDKGFEFIMLTDEKFNIVYANDNSIKYSGYTKEEIIGKHHSIFSSKMHTKEFARQFYKTITSGDIFSGIMKYKIKNGNIVNFYTTIIPFTEKGKITHYISIGKKIDEEQRLRVELDKVLHYDNTTELYNMLSFKESVKRFLERAKIQNQLGAIALINPLSFKNINQAFGFETGNEILKLIGKRLTKNLRKYDVVARLESDRFGILLKDLKQETDAVGIATKLIETLSKPYKLEKKNISLSFNIGISLFPKDGSKFEELLDKAQIALIDAKNKGENRIGFFRKHLGHTAQEKLKLKSELENAIKTGEIEPFFQPYVNKDGEIVGCEALMRWKKENRTILPSEFIPILEETYLIVDAEKQIFKKIINYLSIMDTKNFKISINFSDKTFSDKNFLDFIINHITKRPSVGNKLKIELLERTFIKNFDVVKFKMKKLKEYGIKFSLDDFGTGYSSLSYLSELPVDYLKIDISFIRKLTTDKHTKDIVESIIFVSKKLKIKTIAEGVETEEQFNILKNMGCDYFQGYLFFKPMPIEDIKKFI